MVPENNLFRLGLYVHSLIGLMTDISRNNVAGKYDRFDFACKHEIICELRISRSRLLQLQGIWWLRWRAHRFRPEATVALHLLTSELRVAVVLRYRWCFTMEPRGLVTTRFRKGMRLICAIFLTTREMPSDLSLSLHRRQNPVTNLHHRVD